MKKKDLKEKVIMKNIKVSLLGYKLLNELKADLVKEKGRWLTYSEVIEHIPTDVFKKLIN
jgi:hypothetical protein